MHVRAKLVNSGRAGMQNDLFSFIIKTSCKSCFFCNSIKNVSVKYDEEVFEHINRAFKIQFINQYMGIHPFF